MKTHNSQILLIGAIAIAILSFSLGYIVRGTSQSTDKTNSIQQPMMKTMGDGMMMDHGAMVNSEADFIMEMIPHHQEAIDSSKYMLSLTTDEVFKTFLQNIINAQTQEVAMMKQWHSDWFGSEYKDDGRYEAMMPDLESMDYEQARTQYLAGMIGHHQGAIQMASKVKTISQRPEVIQLADNIIESQNKEIEQMRSWLKTTNNNDTSDSMMMDHMGH